MLLEVSESTPFFKVKFLTTIQAQATASQYKMWPRMACRYQIACCWLYETGHYKGQLINFPLNVTADY